MSHGTDALYGFAAHDPRRSAPRALSLAPRARSQGILGNVALAFVATTCLWTVYAHVGENVGENSIATNTAKPAALPVRTVGVVPSTLIRESFAALRLEYSGLLDGRQLRLTPGTLARGKPSTLAAHLAALAPFALPKSQDRFAMSQPPPGPIARGVPLPAPRPAMLASLRQDPDTSTPAPFRPKAMVEDKATVLALISSNRNSLFNKLFGKPKHEGPTLAYASADGGIAGDAQTILFDGMPKYDQWTAVYDISARTVYLPDGTELEAHSGLGSRMDDPRHVHRKMHGATPPHVYDLSMRESLFHGVEALRMKPVGGEGRIFGRTGLLAHTYLLGPRGDSNGCVSFRDYERFLQAFKKGLVKRMVVVARLG